jgi:hypothetical protein
MRWHHGQRKGRWRNRVSRDVNRDDRALDSWSSWRLGDEITAGGLWRDRIQLRTSLMFGVWTRYGGGRRGGVLCARFMLTRGDDHRLKGDALPGSVAPDPCSRNPLHDVSPVYDVRRPLRVDVGQGETGLHGRIPVHLNLGVFELARLDVEGVGFHVFQILWLVPEAPDRVGADQLVRRARRRL